ncbi:MAG: glycerophosphodiester phosphodiesterase family protein [Oscillospiraceae bacterium]
MLFLLRPTRLKPEQKAAFSHRNYAHRGLYSPDQTVPENTLLAFSRAIEAGYGFEFDIQMSKDGDIVVFHDDIVDRMTTEKGRVDSFTTEQLLAMPLANTEHRIPLFENVLKLVAGQVPLIIELKPSPNYKELCQKAVEMLKNYQGVYCVESFDPRIVRWFKKNEKSIVRGQLANPMKDYKGLPKFATFCLANSLSNVMCRPHFIAYKTNKSSPLVRLAEGMGAMTVVWTVRPEHKAKFFEETCDCVIFEHYLPDPKF